MAAKGIRGVLRRVGWLGAVALLLVGGTRAYPDDGAEEVTWTSSTAGLEVTGLSALAMHPKRPDRLFAHVHGVGVARSADDGQTWETLHQGLDPRHVPGPRDDVQIAVDSREEDVVWLVTKGHVYKSENGGENWRSATTGALVSYSWDKRTSEYHVRGVAVDPNKSVHVLAGTRTAGEMRGGLYETWDGGKTWEQIAGTDMPKSGLGFDAWPIVLDPRTDKNVVVGGSGGVWYSDDRGRDFTRVDPGELGQHDVRDMTPVYGRSREIYLADARGLWRSRDGGRRWDKKPLVQGDCVAVGRASWSKNLILAAFRERGLVRSDDGGREWTDIGLADADIREIFAHPRNKDIVYFASPTTGLYISKDAGETVEPVSMNVKPVVPGLVWVATQPAAAGHFLAVSDVGRVWTSTDDAVTWTPAGRLTNRPDRIVGDPASADTWYATGDALLKTEDGGATWSEVWKPEDPEERIEGFHHLADGSLYFVLDRSRQLVRSADGVSWTVVKPPGKSAELEATDLAVDTSDSKHLLAATRATIEPWTPKEEEGGPYESWDGGNSWHQLTEGLGEEKKQRPRHWNRGRMVEILPGAGMLLYAAEDLGLFARRVVGPKEKPDIEPRWIDLGLPLPQTRLLAWYVAPAAGDQPSEVVFQIGGENEARALVKTTVEKIVERVTAVEGGEEKPEGTIWDTLPDPGSVLACLVGDPHVPGRLLGTDARGQRGVLMLGKPGTAEAAAPDKPTPDRPTPPKPAPSGADAAPKAPEGLLGFSAGADGAVRVWDISQQKPLANLVGHTGEVFDLALAPDESVVVTGGEDGVARAFDATSGEVRATLDRKDQDTAVNAVAFGPASDKVYLGTESSWSVLEWTLPGQDTREFVGHSAAVLAVAVSPDGTRVASGSRDHTVRLWSVESTVSTARFDFGAEVLTVAFSPDGSRLYAGGRGAAVKVFDVAGGTMVAGGDVQGSYVTDIVVSPDGSLLYVSGDKGVRAVSAADLSPAETPAGGAFHGPKGAVFSLALSKDGSWLFGGDAENAVWLWWTGAAEPVWSVAAAHAGAVHAVALTPDVAKPEQPAASDAGANDKDE